MTKDSADHSKDSPAPPDLDLHVDSVIQQTLQRLGVTRLGQVAALDIGQLTQQRGLGVKKLEVLRKLILAAREKLAQGASQNALLGDQGFTAPEQDAGDLLFVPGLLKNVLRDLGITTAADLLNVRVEALENRRGWGEGKLQLLSDLQTLYRNFSREDQVVESSQRVSDVVPATLLPNAECGQMSVAELLSASTGELNLTGRRETEFHELKRFFLDPVGEVVPAATAPEAPSIAPYATMDWRDVPLVLPPRVATFVEQFDSVTIGQLHELATTGLFMDSTTSDYDSRVVKGLGETSLQDLASELKRLIRMGLDGYRFGDRGKPRTACDLTTAAREILDPRDFDVLRLRCDGLTLEEIAVRFSLTRERVRQLEKRAAESCIQFRSAAQEILAPFEERLNLNLSVDAETCLTLTGADQHWQFRMTTVIASKNYSLSDNGQFTLLTYAQRKAIETLFRQASRKDEFNATDGIVSLQELVDLAGDAQQESVRVCRQILQAGDLQLNLQKLRAICGDESLRQHIRSQITAAQGGKTKLGGQNGLFVDQIKPLGLFSSIAEVTEIVADEADVLPDGRFRRPGKVYRKADELIEIIGNSDRPLTAPEIAAASREQWQQGPLVGRYLTALYEIVAIDRGHYVHIDRLSLTVRDVIRIADWGAELLAGEQKVIDGAELFDLYTDANLGLPLENAHQLVSIVAKHPDVRRLSNNLQLAHRDSFDERELYLASTDPDLAAEWHPEKNGATTPETVRPASNKIFWWRCKKGHEFQASPVYRTRQIRSCPGCQERWNLAKIRHFVRSLREHLETLTPAELYVIFQQSGLLQKGGKARGFVKALTTGRFPKQELDKFCEGQESLVDEFIDDSDLTLETTVPLDDQEQVHKTHDETDTLPDKSNIDVLQLPEVRTKDALSALDNPVIVSTDSEATEFLIKSAKAKVWSHAYRDEQEAVEEVGKFGGGVYAEQVCREFIEEYEAARDLALPEGYSFTVDGKLTFPNLMQKQVAAQIRKHRRYGNWSGTGAGKTLSAILATRVVDASLTVVCCPNAIVGASGDGWASEIRRVFPDSEVITKTLSPEWSGESQHRYLVLNYEQFQQPGSEASLKEFLDNQQVDFVVIDEIHYAKQRHAEKMSQRKRLVQALVAVAAESNPDLCVLGMSATPVINNLQEGKSLVEMVSGVEHDDLNVKATVPNCMQLHQKLVTLGTRWRPSYVTQLQIETVDVDCSEYLDEIRALGKSSSPLQYEMILTRARLPVILDHLSNGRQTLVYTHYVQEIDRLLNEAISAAGYRVGFCTGETKSGLAAFKQGKLDVLIGSSAVGTGIDGLQYCCNQLIINVLPWTNAEYEQLIGRIWRQGQTQADVKVVIPVTYADVNGERWSYCDTKLQRIRYKKSIADSAVDGAVPEGNLRSPGQAQQDVIAWLNRLTEGQLATIARRKLVVPLSGDVQDVRRRIAKYGDFSQLNNRWNQTHSNKLAERLQGNPEEWEQYHTLYREARAHWSVVPLEEMIAWCNNREGYQIGDFGCGEALLAEGVGDRHTVHSFDHIAINDAVIEGDMSATPLDNDSLDVAIFSLSLMGHNFTDYLLEAHRVLKIDGQLHIWEATSRFRDVNGLCASLEQLGFKTFQPEEKGRFTHITAQKTSRNPVPGVTVSF